ncbi:MAG: hypothetical protein ACLS48_04070 [[Eubacterium] siraeum]
MTNETESKQNDIATEEAVSEPVEDAVKAFEETAEQEETADSEVVIDLMNKMTLPPKKLC